MANAPDDAERRQQFLRGTADLLLLATIAHTPGHAYELATRLSDTGMGTFSYGTIYPLIARLRSAGLLSETTHPSTRGPARKVYDLTPAGHTALHQWSTQWHHLHQATSAYLQAMTTSMTNATSTPTPSSTPPRHVPGAAVAASPTC